MADARATDGSLTARLDEACRLANESKDSALYERCLCILGEVARAADALGVLSSGQRMFLSAMVSFYNAREGGAMLKRCHFHGLSDFDGLDLQRRKVIADLLVNYNGW